MLFNENDLGLDGSIQGAPDAMPPTPDNYYGEPAQQPTTPAGAGTGYFIDPSQQSQMWGTLQQALNYAMQRDQQKFALEHGIATANGTMVPTPQQAAKMKNQQLMLMAGIGLIVYLIAKA